MKRNNIGWWILVICTFALVLTVAYCGPGKAFAKNTSETKENTLLILFDDNVSTHKLGIKYHFRVSLNEDRQKEAKNYFENIRGVTSATVNEYSIIIDRGAAFLPTEIHQTVSDYLLKCSGATDVKLSHNAGCEDLLRRDGVNSCKEHERKAIYQMIQEYSYSGQCD